MTQEHRISVYRLKGVWTAQVNIGMTAHFFSGHSQRHAAARAMNQLGLTDASIVECSNMDDTRD